MKEVLRSKKGQLYIVFEYMQSSLLDLTRVAPLPESRVRNIMSALCSTVLERTVAQQSRFQILSALQYLHDERNCFHRDLKVRNSNLLSPLEMTFPSRRTSC